MTSVLGADIVGHLLGVFQVDGVDVHADGEGLDGLFRAPGRHGADQAGIQTAGEQEAHGGVRIQPLFDAGNQLVVNFLAGGFHIVMDDGCRLADLPVANELAVHVVVARREGENSAADPTRFLASLAKMMSPPGRYP